jgi:hypothetical protein
MLVFSETRWHCGMRALYLVTESVTEIMQVWTMNVHRKEQYEREKAEWIPPTDATFRPRPYYRIYVYIGKTESPVARWDTEKSKRFNAKY